MTQIMTELTDARQARRRLEDLKTLNREAQTISAKLAEAERCIRMAELCATEDRRRVLIAHAQPLLNAAAEFLAVDPPSCADSAGNWNCGRN